jgi:hypothetical protein
MSDSIDALATDDSKPSAQELIDFNSVFAQSVTTTVSLFERVKGLWVLCILFAIFQFKEFDDFLKKLLPFTNISNYMLIGVKSVIFCFAFFIVQNFRMN